MLQNQELITKTQSSFGGGMNSDEPATELGADELAAVFNQICYPKYTKGRTGCRPMRTLQVPCYDFREYVPLVPAINRFFSASKSGNKVYLYGAGSTPDGRLYTYLVEGNYIVWSDGTRDQITHIDVSDPSAPFFTSATSEERDYDSHVEQQHKVWGAGYSEETGNIIIQLGTKLYFTDNTFQEYKEIYPAGAAGGDILAESRTNFDFDEDEVIAYNTNGIFRIIFDENSGYYFKINGGQPTVRIYENTFQEVKANGRNRIYTLARIIGPGCLYGDRRTAECVIQAETAPVLPDANHKDASIAYADLPLGSGMAKYWELSSGSGLVIDIAIWNLYGFGSWRININEIGSFDFAGDFTDAKTMDDVAAEMQRHMRVYFPGCECYFRIVDGNPQLVINGGKLDGTVVGYVEEPVLPGTPTPITGLLQMGGGTTPIGVLQLVSVDAPQMVYDLNTPDNKSTHYGMWGSENAGTAGIAENKLPDLLIWQRDIPIIKAFTATISDDTNPVISVDGDNKYLFRDDEGSYLVAGDTRDVFKITNLLDEKDPALPSYNERGFLASSYYLPIDPIVPSGRASVPCAIGAKKISRAYQVGDTVVLDGLDPAYQNSWNKFSQEDAGRILFVEDGSVRHILRVNADNQCTVQEDIEFGQRPTDPMDPATGIWLAVAWDPIRRLASGTNNTKLVIFDKVQSYGSGTLYRVGGDEFDPSDNGKKMMVFMDGRLCGPESLTLTIDYFNKNMAVFADGNSTPDEIAFGLPHSSMYGIITDYVPARFYNDFITDEDLDSRADDPSFVLQTRFFRPLPSSHIGALGSNFMFVCEPGTGKIVYSEAPATRKHIVGFHHPAWQVDTGIRDVVTRLKDYPDRMVAFGRTSTWGTNYTAFTALKTPDIGEEIFLVPAFTIIDSKGLTHIDSLQDIAIGQSIMLNNDAGARLFDGRQYSDANLAENKIWKTLRLWHTRVMSSYDGNGGYMIFGSPNVSSDARNYVNMTEGACFRFAVLPHQGSQWTQFGGEKMVSPMPNTGGLNIDDTHDMPIQIMLDERTGRWYQISTYNGPAGSDLEESFVDKDNTEIVNSCKGPAHQGSRFQVMLEHMESHAQILPIRPGASFRTGFIVTTKIYVANGTVYSAKTVDTPVDGDIVYDRKINDPQIQNEYEFSASAVILCEIETMYVTRDTAGATAMDKRPTSESNHQQEYSSQ
jgi:hypothetical protein